MGSNFDYFVVYAEMRTGSNFLETNLNAIDSVSCLGEAFNPHFIGYPNKTEILNVTQAERDADPERLLASIKGHQDMAGFRFFHDHDPRVLDLTLKDPRCAKIILTRNPLDSYVSWKIAQATGQWKLTDVKRRKDAKAVFDPIEFAAHVSSQQAFQLLVLNRLQSDGQTAFYIGYEDLHDLGVINGLVKWLGVDGQLTGLDKSLKPQNPKSVLSKVANPEDMKIALSDLDAFNLTRTPNFEPRRGPVVPSYVACAESDLLYLPIRGGPEDQVVQWMAKLDGVAIDDLPSRMNQKQLRQWKRKRPGHRSFTVLRHPVARIHSVFCDRIVNTGDGGFLQIRETLIRQFKLPLPKEGEEAVYTRSAHRAAFESFLSFLKLNLAGQTAIRTDAGWATQSQSIAGFGDFVLPDHVLREDELSDALPSLAKQIGHANPPEVPEASADRPFALEDIYDAEIEAMVSDVYQRDYMMFGFGPWQSVTARSK